MSATDGGFSKLDAFESFEFLTTIVDMGASVLEVSTLESLASPPADVSPAPATGVSPAPATGEWDPRKVLNAAEI
jgi:hypothetical protein